MTRVTITAIIDGPAPAPFNAMSKHKVGDVLWTVTVNVPAGASTDKRNAIAHAAAPSTGLMGELLRYEVK